MLRGWFQRKIVISAFRFCHMCQIRPPIEASTVFETPSRRCTMPMYRYGSCVRPMHKKGSPLAGSRDRTAHQLPVSLCAPRPPLLYVCRANERGTMFLGPLSEGDNQSKQHRYRTYTSLLPGSFQVLDFRNKSDCGNAGAMRTGKAKATPSIEAAMAERECSGGFLLTPLMKAAMMGDIAAASHAIEAMHCRGDGDGNLNGVNHEGCTALMLACRAGHIQVINALLQAGCELDQRDAEGRDAAAIADSAGHVECAVALRREAAARLAMWSMITGEAREAPAALISNQARAESVMDKMLREAGLSTGCMVSGAREAPF